MRKIIFIIFIVYMSGFITHVKAVDIVDKERLPYEVLHVDIKNEQLTIEGWGFVNILQHFLNDTTHSYQVEFRSKNHSFIVDASSRYSTQTELVKFAGTRRCANNQYYMYGNQCYYDYQNVGFKAVVPLSSFQENADYTVYLIVNAKTTNKSFKTVIYFPMQQDVVDTSKNIRYSISSRLDDTSIIVNHTTVLARSTPAKYSNYIYHGNWCSNSFKNRLYFAVNTTYNTIFAKQRVNDVHYYQVKGSLSYCENQRRRVKEGNDIYPMWIASTFVDYSGTSLHVKTENINTPPVITIKENPRIKRGTEIEFKNYVSAFDAQDLDITHKIVLIKGSVDFNKIGNYTLTYEVVDSGGLKDTKEMYVTIYDTNEPPSITAYDKTLLQYQSFDPLKNVSATDYEDGDITYKLDVLNTVDTSIVETQQVCYQVKDSKAAVAYKCINIFIKEKQVRSLNTRFIQKSHLFYQEDVPLVWKDKINDLTYEIDNNYPYYAQRLEK